MRYLLLMMVLAAQLCLGCGRDITVEDEGLACVYPKACVDGVPASDATNSYNTMTFEANERVCVMVSIDVGEDPPEDVKKSCTVQLTDEGIIIQSSFKYTVEEEFCPLPSFSTLELGYGITVYCEGPVIPAGYYLVQHGNHSTHLGIPGNQSEVCMGPDSYSDTDTDVDTDIDTDTDTDTDTDPDCINGEYSGDFAINSISDAAALAGYTSISGNLDICCPSCTDLSKLTCLTSVGGDLSISWNYSLTDLYDLIALTSVGAVSIHNNGGITDLYGLSGITSMNGSLQIYENAALANLNGLSSLTSMGDELQIYSNNILPDCEVCDLLGQLTSGPASIDVYDNLDDSCTPVPANCP